MSNSTAPSFENAEKAPISINDVASSMKSIVGDNDRPYDKIAKTHFNRLVEQWYEEVLIKVANTNSQIQVGTVDPLWTAFEEGTDLSFLQNHIDHIPEISDDIVNYWIEKFRLPMEEFVKLGILSMQFGRGIIMDAIIKRQAKLKWDKIYSTTQKKNKWASVANENHNLARNITLPFNLTKEELKTFDEKYHAVLVNKSKYRSG